MFDWSAFLSQAQRLAEGRDEAGYRSSISRAYYSVFGLARRRLRDVERLPVPNTGQAHDYVWRAFASSASDVHRVAIGTDGRRLRNRRRLADYDDVVADLGLLSSECLADAQRVIALIAGLP
jgi:uncharacterized protein (UPF0332 family)